MCEYCEKEDNIFEDDGYTDVSCTVDVENKVLHLVEWRMVTEYLELDGCFEDYDYLEEFNIPIKYCPMCGRKL